MRRVRLLLSGVALVFVGHALMNLIARAIDGDEVIPVMTHTSLLFIGIIQLVYGLPIVLWARRRHPPLALGAILAILATCAVNVVGLRH